MDATSNPSVDKNANICTPNKLDVSETILEAITELREDQRRPDKDSITRYVIKMSGLDKDAIEAAINSLEKSNGIYVKLIRKRESYFINKEHSKNPSVTDVCNDIYTGFSHNQSSIEYLDQIATPSKDTPFSSPTLEPNKFSSRNSTTLALLNIRNKLVERNADINRQLSLERIINQNLMEEIASHKAKVSGSMIDRRVQVSITSKDVENLSIQQNKR